MKKLLTLLVAAATLCLSFSSCQKADSWDFDYSQETLCNGTWHGTAVYSKGSWIDITGIAFAKLQFTIKFNTDGSYYGTGYFGNGSGTYTASGKTINTYVDGQPYYTYTVKSMSGNDAELTMTSSKGSSLDIRVTKK